MLGASVLRIVLQGFVLAEVVAGSHYYEGDGCSNTMDLKGDIWDGESDDEQHSDRYLLDDDLEYQDEEIVEC